jgi:hypothetical protein
MGVDSFPNRGKNTCGMYPATFISNVNWYSENDKFVSEQFSGKKL